MLSLMVLQTRPFLSYLTRYLRLVLIALDHLLKMLFHGELARATREISSHLLLLFFGNNHSLDIFICGAILILLVILHLCLIEGV